MGGIWRKPDYYGAEGHHPRSRAHRELHDLHHNWLYEFLEPGDEEIIAAYVTLNGPEPAHESDADESSSSSSDEESDDADADEGEAGDSMQTE